MEIQLRKVNTGDLEFLFNLRNEEGTRLASFNNDPISLETHRNWFEKKIANNESILYIAEENSKPIAQVRFDWLNGSEAEVNVAVAKDFRGRGYGSEILKNSSHQFFQEFPNCNKIYAFIKPDNRASIKSFGKAGYSLNGQTDHKGQICVEMILTR